LPLNTWIEIELTAALGDAAGHWNLSVRMPGEETSRFEKLPLKNPEWRSLEWLGFVSQSSVDSEIWIDNLELTR